MNYLSTTTRCGLFSAFISTFVLPVTSVLADSQIADATTLPPLVISATRNPTSVKEVASSITVITAADIERKQQRTLTNILRDVPGLYLVQAGGPGSPTSIFMRGTNSNHIKVIVDGIDVSDPSTPNGSFDYAHMLTNDIEQIEVLRGPQSGLYGSDAIGGVILITTKKGNGVPRLSGSVEAGSFGTFNQSAALSGSSDKFNYAFNADHYRSTDVQVTPENLVPAGGVRFGNIYDNKTFSTKLGVGLTDNFDVGLVARYVDTDLRYTGDDYSTFPATPAQFQSLSQTNQTYARGTAHLALFDGVFDQTVGFGYTNDRRADSSPVGAPSSVNTGTRYKGDWLGNVRLMEGQMLTLGAEYQRDEMKTQTDSVDNSNRAATIQLQSAFGDSLFSTISVRYDDNKAFGGKTTFRIAPAYLIQSTGTKLKASVGTGFKAPTLSQLFVDYPLFGFFANPNLRPEESLGYDFGFEQAVPVLKTEFGATWFQNDIKDLISNNATFTSYINVAKAETHGLEAFVHVQPLDVLSLRADYTFTIANDETNNFELLRRPRHKATLEATWLATDALSLSSTVLYTSSWVDGNRDFSVQRLKAKGYVTVNLAADYVLNEQFTLFGHIDNLLDREYENPVGFLQPGIGAFAGIRASF
ncbi:MAG: TonB-dependent receptor plug domain-containing protein [Parvibaculaceae bacterium]